LAGNFPLGVFEILTPQVWLKEILRYRFFFTPSCEISAIKPVDMIRFVVDVRVKPRNPFSGAQSFGFGDNSSWGEWY
jgi:hypothetical protein